MFFLQKTNHSFFFYEDMVYDDVLYLKIIFFSISNWGFEGRVSEETKTHFSHFLMSSYKITWNWIFNEL